jgi:hypothetical protein
VGGCAGTRHVHRNIRYDFAFVALYFAQRLLVASIIRFRPAVLNLRFLVPAFAGGASFTFFVAEYLLR